MRPTIVLVHGAFAESVSLYPPQTFTQGTPGGKMSTQSGGESTFLHELEVKVRTELAVAKSCQPLEDADGVPTLEWLLDPDAPRYEVSLSVLLGAVEVLEDGYCPQRPSSAVRDAEG